MLELLRQQHPLVHRYWHDTNVAVQDFTDAGVVVTPHASGALLPALMKRS